MNLLFLSIAYPDVDKTGNLYTSLTHELAKKGHNIRVVAPTFDGRTRMGTEGEVKVLRVHSGPLFNTGLIRKGFNTLLLCHRFHRTMRQYRDHWRSDWIVTSTPPITLGKLVRHLRSLYKARCYLILRDIFPQNAKDLGLINNPVLFNFFRHNEKLLYRHSDVIGCMSPKNIQFVERQNPHIPSKKLKLLPNWIRPMDKDYIPKSHSRLWTEYGFRNKFIALFGGNFGKPQRVGFILDLAAKAQELEDVAFVLIGDGTEKPRIERQVTNRNLNNVYIFDRLPRHEYQALSCEADIGIVTLSEKFTIPNIPSRTLGYWDAQLPILAATDTNTDYKEILLDRYNAGLWAETGDLDNFYAQFLRFYNDRQLCRQMGANGRRAVINHFSVDTIAQRMIEQMESIND